jgi:hypothetical protein
MKGLKFAVPVVALLAVLAVVPVCNRADQPMTPANPASLAGAASEMSTVVIIDIVPHRPSNLVNCTAANRLLAVAIMSEGGFDATTVDHATVVFEGATEAHIDPETLEPVRHEIDVDEDDDLDLVLHFLLKETNLTCDSKEGCLSGKTYGGESIAGCDSIKMFKRKR